MLTIPYPNIDPVALQIGPFTIDWFESFAFDLGPLEIRWYALAYLAGLVLGWRYCVWMSRKDPWRPNAIDFDDFLAWAVIGVIVGGRAGFVFFYNFPYYYQNPLEAFQIWKGGMSFHGGCLGVIVAVLLFCHARRISPFAFGDLVAVATPIGLFFGRIANFINGELYGRVADVPWAMVFPRGGPVPRHPSQLYEAALEGVLLFLILHILAQRQRIRTRWGTLTGIFLVGYGLTRGTAEFFRYSEPDIVFLSGHLTMGQLLCIPMIFIGLIFLIRAKPVKVTSAADPRP